MKKLILLPLTLVIVFSTTSLLAQQTTGQINGTVLDTQGAALVKAQVTVVNSSNGFYLVHNKPHRRTEPGTHQTTTSALLLA